MLNYYFVSMSKQFVPCEFRNLFQVYSSFNRESGKLYFLPKKVLLVIENSYLSVLQTTFSTYFVQNFLYLTTFIQNKITAIETTEYFMTFPIVVLSNKTSFLGSIFLNIFKDHNAAPTVNIKYRNFRTLWTKGFPFVSQTVISIYVFSKSSNRMADRSC